MAVANSDLLSSPIQLTYFGIAFVSACRPLGTAPPGMLGVFTPE